MNVLSVLTNSTEQEPRDYSPLCMCKTKVQWVSLENRLFVRDDINASICLFTLKHLKLVWWSHGSHGSIKTQAYIDFLLRLWEKKKRKWKSNKKETSNKKKQIHSPQKYEKRLKSYPTYLHAPLHLRASFVIYIHNVQFQILSWGMIIPQILTSNTFYSLSHGCGITL